MIRFGLPVAILTLLLVFFYNLIPDRRIPAYIDHDLIEANYGPEMDAALATLEANTVDEMMAERKRLADWYSKDPTIARVWLADDRVVSTKNIYWQDVPGGRGGTCRSVGRKYKDHGLMRCTTRIGLFGGKDTLRYRRNSWTPEGYKLEMEFDYDKFLAKHPGS